MRPPPRTIGALQRLEAEGGIVLYRSPRLTRLGLPHAFSTRRGPGGLDELDVGKLDEPTRERLLRLSGCEGPVRLVRAEQVHGPSLAWVEDVQDSLARPRVDALLSRTPALVPLIVTADCVPILLARGDGSAVAAVHAGWRGLVRGVIGNARRALGGERHLAAIGPCLSLERFEVGEEVVEQFLAAGLEPAIQPSATGKSRIDLRLAARLELERHGPIEIDLSDRCTFDDEELWSYRRDVTRGGAPRTGRLGAWIGCGVPQRSARAEP